MYLDIFSQWWRTTDSFFLNWANTNLCILFKNFGNHVEDGQKKEGLGGRKINWVIGDKMEENNSNLYNSGSALFSLCTMERMVHSRCGREEGLLYGGLPVIQEREEYKIIVEFPVYVTGKKLMLLRPRRSKKEGKCDRQSAGPVNYPCPNLWNQ